MSAVTATGPAPVLDDEPEVDDDRIAEDEFDEMMPARDEFDGEHHYEIIDGIKVGLPPMSTRASRIATRLVRRLGNFAEDADLGEVHSEMLFKLPLAKDRSRKPDVAFVSYARWAKDRDVSDANAWDVLPELCVEVVSPTDRAEDVREKTEEYLRAGVSLVWVVYPRIQVVDVYEPGGVIRTLRRADALDGGPVLPGFTLPLAGLFPQPAGGPSEPRP